MPVDVCIVAASYPTYICLVEYFQRSQDQDLRCLDFQSLRYTIAHPVPPIYLFYFSLGIIQSEVLFFGFVINGVGV